MEIVGSTSGSATFILALLTDLSVYGPSWSLLWVCGSEFFFVVTAPILIADSVPYWDCDCPVDYEGRGPNVGFAGVRTHSPTHLALPGEISNSLGNIVLYL